MNLKPDNNNSNIEKGLREIINKVTSIFRRRKTNNILSKAKRFINLNDFKIHNKLLIMVSITGLIPIIILSGLIVNNASTKIEDEILKSNELFTTLTKERINKYFYNREVDGQLLAKSRIISHGVEELNSFNSSDEEEQKIMDDFQEYLDIVLEKHGYTDIFLTNKYGEGIFSNRYERIDMAPIIFSGDFSQRAMEEQTAST